MFHAAASPDSQAIPPTQGPKSFMQADVALALIHSRRPHHKQVLPCRNRTGQLPLQVIGIVQSCKFPCSRQAAYTLTCSSDYGQTAHTHRISHAMWEPSTPYAAGKFACRCSCSSACRLPVSHVPESRRTQICQPQNEANSYAGTMQLMRIIHGQLRMH